MMRAMSAEMGEDLGPELEEVVERLERGESPEEIEKTMPDLLGEEEGTATSETTSENTGEDFEG